MLHVAKWSERSEGQCSKKPGWSFCSMWSSGQMVRKTQIHLTPTPCRKKRKVPQPGDWRANRTRPQYKKDPIAAQTVQDPNRTPKKTPETKRTRLPRRPRTTPIQQDPNRTPQKRLQRQNRPGWRADRARPQYNPPKRLQRTKTGSPDLTSTHQQRKQISNTKQLQNQPFVKTKFIFHGFGNM